MFDVFILQKRTDKKLCSDAYAMRCSFFAFAVEHLFGHFGIKKPALYPKKDGSFSAWNVLGNRMMVCFKLKAVDFQP